MQDDYNRRIYFADEPTGNLDSKTGEEILKLLQEINRKHHKTIIMVTHSDEAATYCTRYIKVKDREIIQNKTIDT